MKKNLKSILAMGLMCSMLVVSCGQESTSNNNVTTAPTESAVTTPEATATPEATSTPTPEPTATPTPEPTPVPMAANMLELYADQFKVGVALNPSDFDKWNRYGETIVENFNSFSCENEMKPDATLDRSGSQAGLADGSTYLCPAVRFSAANKAVLYALENDIQIRLHTLVWHAQTPHWFFTEDYTDSGEYVSREVMLQRLENYIRQVLTYYDEEYPGLIYAVDVVNEAFNGPVSESNPYGITEMNGDRPNDWYQVLGNDYVYYAFLYARKYAPDYMKLIYNDYAMSYKKDRVVKGLQQAQDEGLIDGIGMQSHVSATDDMQQVILNTVKYFCRAGYEVQMTEFDMGLNKAATDADYQRQARKFKYVAQGLQKLVEEGYNFTSLTFWGLTDRPASGGWRAGEHALLFDEIGIPKLAYYGMLQDESIRAMDY